jgi:hypothetical protein
MQRILALQIPTRTIIQKGDALIVPNNKLKSLLVDFAPFLHPRKIFITLILCYGNTKPSSLQN